MEAPRWIHDDGQTRAALPSRFARDGDGAWSIPTTGTAARFGWHPVTEVRRPTVDPWDTAAVDVVADGDGFTQRWTVTRGVEPLVDPADRPSEDEVAASIALLTEDSVAYRALLTVIVQALNIPASVIEAAGAAATDRLVALADNPEVRRAMMEARLTKAEQARKP